MQNSIDTGQSRGLSNNCLKCEKELSGKQVKYCSEHCGKLYLKAQYRKRNREKVNKYNREYRKWAGRNASKTETEFAKIKETLRNYLLKECRRCKRKDKLTINHIRPLSAEGTNDLDNLETLCSTCNNKDYKELVAKALKFYFDHDHEKCKHG